MITYVPKRLSGWGVEMLISHDLDVTQRLLENEPDACCQQTPRSWQQNRMQQYNANRLKLGGTNAAQTPSKRPHRAPSYKSTVQGAQQTTANQSTPTVDKPRTQGGGQRVRV